MDLGTTKRRRKEPKAQGGERRSGDGKNRRRKAERAEGGEAGKNRSGDGRTRRLRAKRDEAGTEIAEEVTSGGGNNRALPGRAEEEDWGAEHFRTAPKRGRGHPSASERRRSAGGDTRSSGEAGKMEAPGPDSQCGLCGAAAAPYTCPRCNRRLCSLRCYRAHGVCSEAFYREQVLQTLRSDRGPPPALPGLGAALRRPRQLREAEASAGCEGRGLWGSLSAAEQAAFQRLIRTGEAAKLIPAWRPWWWRRNKGKNEDKYEHKDEDEDEDEPQIAPPPAIPSSIPALSSFLAPPPSPLLRFQLPNVLFGYVFALSLHGGDESLVPELPGAAIDVAAALRMRRAFRSTAEALRAARDDAKGAGYPTGPLGDAGTVLAVAELLEGPGDDSDNYTQNNAANYNNNYVIMALAHLEQLLSRGRLNLDAKERQTFVNAQRKCRFLMSWSQEAPMGTMVELARETREVVNELISANEGMGQGEIFSANEGRGSRLIEELD